MAFVCNDVLAYESSHDCHCCPLYSNVYLSGRIESNYSRHSVSISRSRCDFEVCGECIASCSEFMAILAFCCIHYIQISEEEALHGSAEFMLRWLDCVFVSWIDGREWQRTIIVDLLVEVHGVTKNDKMSQN